MFKKNVSLLAGVSVMLLGVPTTWAKTPEALSLIEESPAVNESSENYRLVDGQVRSRNSQTSFLELSQSTKQQQLAQLATPSSGAQTPVTGSRTSVTEIQNEIKGQQSQSSSRNRTMSQVTGVSQLSDVQPTDWAFAALQSLVERYGCIEGYPDRTYRGNRAMTRYEFAAGLNACLNRIVELIEAAKPEVKQEDLETIRRLQTEFRTELDGLRGRIDSLEARTGRLEAQKFTSSYTVVGGEAIFALSDAFGGNPPGRGETNTIFTYLLRLQTATTFSGKDRLRMELSAGNFGGPIEVVPVINSAGNVGGFETRGLGFASTGALNTNNAFLSFQSNTENDVQLSMLEYRFPAFSDRVVFTIRPVGFNLNSVLSANSPFFDAGRGAISRFAEAPPAFKIGDLDAGVGLDWLMNRKLRFQLAYGSRNSNDPGRGFLFGKDSYSAGAQLLFLPGNSVLTGLSFIYGYSPDGRLNTFTGSAIADASGYINRPSNIYAVNGSIQWRFTRQLTFAAWGGIVGTYSEGTQNGAISTNYMLSLGLSDPFGREGDLMAVMFGQPPKIVNTSDLPVEIDLGEFTQTSLSTGLGEEAASYHIEAFYRYTVNDNISITPGFFIVTNPGNIEDNNTIFIGTLRTTFRF